MKILFILRHAKSSWSDADLADFDRPLNDRGMRAAPFMGELMKREGFEPPIILSSPALRAKRTAAAVKNSAGLSAEIRLEHQIYEASPHSLRQIVSALDDKHDSAMLVGHNPGIEGLIRYLTGRLEPMPTAALAVIQLEIDEWASIDDGCGELRKIYRPKEEMRSAD